MKQLIYPAMILAAATAARAGGPEIRSCAFEVKARCASGDASVTLKDGVVTRLEVNMFWCGENYGQFLFSSAAISIPHICIPGLTFKPWLIVMPQGNWMLVAGVHDPLGPRSNSEHETNLPWGCEV